MPTEAGSALVGYDGSPAASDAIEVGADLLPDLGVRVVNLWTPPLADDSVRSRLLPRASDLDELIALVEREGEAQAERLVNQGVALARAAGWTAEPMTQRCRTSLGLELARLAGRLSASTLVVGSRGMSGIRAFLGSTSDMAVHYCPVPVLVAPQPFTVDERAVVCDGPVLIGNDGSDGARSAIREAAALFAGRELIVASVSGEPTSQAPEEVDAVGAQFVSLRPVGVSSSPRAVADALGQHASACGAAVIVVGSRGRSPAREILLGSVAMAVLHHARRPALVVPASSRLPGAS